MELKRVEGKKRGHIVLYALSTCGWCKKTKDLLNQLGVEYYFIDVDLLEGAERSEVMKEVEKWNPNRSFPTIVVDNKTCIVGFNEAEIRRVLGL